MNVVLTGTLYNKILETFWRLHLTKWQRQRWVMYRKVTGAAQHHRDQWHIQWVEHMSLFPIQWTIQPWRKGKSKFFHGSRKSGVLYNTENLAEKQQIYPELKVSIQGSQTRKKNMFSKSTEGWCLYRWISKDILICLKMSESVVKSTVITPWKSFLLFHWSHSWPRNLSSIGLC